MVQLIVSFDSGVNNLGWAHPGSFVSYLRTRIINMTCSHLVG